MDMLARLLDAIPPPTDGTLAAWWEATSAGRAEPTTTIDRALVGGALADRLGFAFANAYAEALRALVPDLSANNLAALCATEDGGNHPRAIKTALTPVPDTPTRYTLTGHKKWATAANAASTLLVVASIGEDPATRHNRLRVVAVPTNAPNLRVVSSSAPFIPEIQHAEIHLDGVVVPAESILPGDGYDAYLKPFRTVEDLHVHAALAGYLLGVVRRHNLAPTLVESLLAIAAAARSLASNADSTITRSSPATHLALAGLIDHLGQVTTELERAWATAPDDEFTRWQRDRMLLQTAGKARATRRDNARASLAPRSS